MHAYRIFPAGPADPADGKCEQVRLQDTVALLRVAKEEERGL